MIPTQQIDETDVPTQALKALREANRRAREAGHTLVVVIGDESDEIKNRTKTVFKTLLPKINVEHQVIELQGE